MGGLKQQASFIFLSDLFSMLGIIPAGINIAIPG